MIIVIAILVGLLCGGIVYFLCNHLELKSNFEAKRFEKEQEKLLKGLQEKKDSFDKELTQEQLIKQEEIRVALEKLQGHYKSKEQEYEARGRELENEYKSKKNSLENEYESRRRNIQFKEMQEEDRRNTELQKKIEEEQQKYNTELNKLSEDYKAKKDDMTTDFFQFSEQINSQKETLQQEINKYEAQQREIIARFKHDEQVRQQANFYSIQISEVEKADVEKLKTLALTFSKPECIYKLIYEVYYKTRLEEMFKRVLGERKNEGGIYKITNIKNQKVYIGKTSASFLTRWRTHTKRGCNIERIKGQLYDAMWEDGLENFTFEILEVCPKEEQTEKEKYWICYYHSDEYGYNMKVG